MANQRPTTPTLHSCRCIPTAGGTYIVKHIDLGVCTAQVLNGSCITTLGGKVDGVFPFL